MANKPIVLILGAGPRIGSSVVEKFLSTGYNVAQVSRTGTTNIKHVLALKADFSNPESIPPIFEAVKAEFHAAPSLVIYNAAALTHPPAADSALSIPVESVQKDMNINVLSPYVAAQQAIHGWESLPKETKKTFIYTGNVTNVTVLPMPMMLTLGMGKSSSAYWVGLADAAYAARGYRFFYADERHEDGKFKGMELDGDAHAEFFAKLAEHEENVPWYATFVKGKGYVQFK